MQSIKTILTIIVFLTVVFSRSFEQQVIDEMNLVRSNPAQYAKDYIVPLLSRYNGKVFTFDDGSVGRTTEGSFAARDCIRFLNSVSSARALRYSEGLALGAQDHGTDLARSNTASHTGTDGSGPGDRISRHGKWSVSCGECITYGYYTPREIVISFLIDDGVPDRGHRGGILAQEFKKSGVYYGNHPSCGTVCVVEFANTYVEGN